ncbi:Bardet-Biedl syndrome 1 protein homolog [Rhopilema esculentum]|uniref:Bardet-Biedl syndrome 1 protein homolog n=1 Tax=Rhopilema esculentum TaxID=499914 RepID=UPI0031E0036C
MTAVEGSLSSPRKAKSDENETGNSYSEGSSVWLNAHYNPVASIYTFTSCTALADLNADGEHKLIVADLGTGASNMKLKVFKGTSLVTESTIIDLPTSVCTFHMDMNEPKTPAVAVASGPYIYVYKNLRPYFKFTLPPLDVNPIEYDLWNQAKENKMDIATLREMLLSIRDANGSSSLTVRSLRFLQLNEEDAAEFAEVHQFGNLRRQTVITCMTTIKKSVPDEDSISCLVIGTESKEVYVLDPEAFTVLAKMSLPSIPSFMSVSGLYDVEFRIVVACRDAKIYNLKSGSRSGKVIIELNSQVVGLERIAKTIIVGCMDQTLACYSTKGKKLWTAYLPHPITTMSQLNHKARGLKAVMVALQNGEVRIYKDKYLVNMFTAEDVIVGIQFGRFGREDNALVMTTKGGGLLIKILKRTANFEGKDLSAGTSTAHSQKLNVPKKTKLFVDQALRERGSAPAIHRVFQQDLYRLKLKTARSYVHAISTRMNPLSTSLQDPVKLSAQVQGLGPAFKLTINIENTSTDTPSTDLLITFHFDSTLYAVAKPMIQIPILIPGLSYSLETLVDCISDKGISDKIRVFLLRRGNSIPIITAVISMPVSEAVVVV